MHRNIVSKIRVPLLIILYDLLLSILGFNINVRFLKVT
jgi:hypothetical protein